MSTPEGWPDDFFDRIMKPEKSPCVENKRGQALIGIIGCLNSIEIIRGGNLDLNATKVAREKFIENNKLPRTSVFYKKGYVIKEDENGIPFYMKGG